VRYDGEDIWYILWEFSGLGYSSYLIAWIVVVILAAAVWRDRRDK
jgi:hypothetical protein